MLVISGGQFHGVFIIAEASDCHLGLVSKFYLYVSPHLTKSRAFIRHSDID